MSFRLIGLNPAPFRHLYGLSDDRLTELGAKRYVVENSPGFPDRVEMRDLDFGETALLVNYVHQPADTPYKASHAIFICEGAVTAYEAVDEMPEVMRKRQLSLRAFDDHHMMVDADLVDGAHAEMVIRRLFGRAEIAYIQAHYAKRGCYAARIERTL